MQVLLSGYPFIVRMSEMISGVSAKHGLQNKLYILRRLAICVPNSIKARPEKEQL